jgi:hypothetical protein
LKGLTRRKVPPLDWSLRLAPTAALRVATPAVRSVVRASPTCQNCMRWSRAISSLKCSTSRSRASSRSC